ncbi:cytochrome c family protein [Maricaulis sp.]|uniref:c-type cytochrome n=1 Tax=Maricaulis sp. TaxID=1486257 RepID=UPI002B269CA4|nr:cytochrome c family protein [Maricaulis sp.]
MSRTLLAILPAFALASCGGEATSPANGPAPAPESSPESAPETVDTAPAGSPQAEGEATAATAPSAILAGLGAEYASADLASGARQFRRCQSCHTLSEGGRHTVGPNLYGIIGAPAANADRFSYSTQLQEAGLTWDLATLDAWIENPRALVPGNRMSFVGLRAPEDRRDVIAYIAVQTATE